ncbi:MAG: yhdN 2 [Herbinix sp.]|jgi:predicted aldo/keto reductase-like oxidoreductase|nr:yhdN 2 [Herbinix sp.]
MEKRIMAGTDYEVSRIGIGGHYRAMEEGEFENRYAYVDQEIEHRTILTKKAVDHGITYFDTTWRNEADLLGKALDSLHFRDKVHVNGMVLGAFRGSEATGLEVEEYFDRWLDKRLATFSGNRFDSIMINAIEENYSEKKCERLIKLLEKRKAEGDFKIYGFSCHDPFHARKVADTFPEFKIIMIPYNYKNRRFEEAFQGYQRDASFIAMKPLVWAEYGIPFCAVNRLENFEQHLGFSPSEDAAAKAIKFIKQNPFITTALCSVNSLEELDILISAGEGSYTSEDEITLYNYNTIHTPEKIVYLYISALLYDNLRMNFFGAANLSRLLNIAMPHIPLNESNSHQRINCFGVR